MINYYLLTKPGIIMGNLITLSAGFFLASKGVNDYPLFLITLAGLALVMASACVCNNYIDRAIDGKMERTKNRPLVKGLISGRNALLFAFLLGAAGNAVLFFYTNLLTVAVAGVGFFVYVVLYSMWKVRTIYGTAIGSISGSVPPIVGYCAVSNQLDAGVFVLFALMVFWQMPHFFSIAMYRFEDYLSASIPVLPVMKGAYRTKWHMIVYIVSFIAMTTALTLLHYTGYIFLTASLILGCAWLALCIKGFKQGNDQLWAKQMFRLSLVVITVLCVTIPFDIV